MPLFELAWRDWQIHTVLDSLRPDMVLFDTPQNPRQKRSKAPGSRVNVRQSCTSLQVLFQWLIFLAQRLLRGNPNIQESSPQNICDLCRTSEGKSKQGPRGAKLPRVSPQVSVLLATGKRRLVGSLLSVGTDCKLVWTCTCSLLGTQLSGSVFFWVFALGQV